MKTRQTYYILDPKTDTKQEGDEYYSSDNCWRPVPMYVNMAQGLVYRRPIPDAPTPDDGWIPWGGGDRPVYGNELVDVKFRCGPVVKSERAKTWNWDVDDTNTDPNDIVAYRVVKAPEPRWLPLTCDDVPPGSVIRGAGEVGESGWCLITSCSLTGIRLWHHCDTNQHERTWASIMDSEIKRPGEDWQPCKKLAK